jgi:ribose transport system ATP-binding protein
VSPARAGQQPLLEADGLSKAYDGIPVLREVSLALQRSEVLGLAGENGAGKSTLLNILSGVTGADSGRLLIGGREVHLDGYHSANAAGVFRVYQELALVPNVPVFENLFLSHEARFKRFGILQRRKMISQASEMLESFGHGWIDPTREVGSLEFPVRQMIEIIKAFALAELLETEHPVLLLDEPTAGLLHDESRYFQELLGQVRTRSSIIFVTHRLSELLELCDRVMVLKDGVVVETAAATELSEERVHKLMVGRERIADFYTENQQVAASQTPALRVNGLSSAGRFADISFDLHEGEILGIAGVLGSGKSELGRALYDPGQRDAGTVTVGDTPLNSGDVVTAIRTGIGYVPPERKEDGALLPHPVSWNISLARVSCAARARGWLLDLGQERDEAGRFIESLSIKTPGAKALLRNLSGGNQQKVVLARWLATDVRVLVLDNPTRGVDAGAKEEIYGVLRELAQRGKAIIVIGDDLQELIGLSGRVMLMKDGRITGVIDAPPEAKPEEVQLVAQIV